MSILAVFLILLGLLCFGIFFLIFKLIWILFKKKRNFWPLVISGVLSGIVVLAAGIFSYAMYRQFVKPFDPIVQTVKTQTTLVDGHRLYTNPLGFAVTLHDGTTLSNWLTVDDWSFLIGVDTNMFVNKKDPNQPFSLYLLGHEVDDEPSNAHYLMSEISQGLAQSNSSKGRIEIEQVVPVNVGTDAEGELMKLTAYPYDHSTPITFSLVIATKGHDTYFLAGLGNAGNDKILDTVSSFVITK
ncbi:MAG: hypothetical protein IJ016_05615 [Elusimicrobiaceae bacterium]|nr:hypothetical protein [Elusimicrobiaceae bacterium]